DELREIAARAGAVPIALRNSDFSFQPKTRIAQQVGALAAAGGLTVVLAENQLRAAAAARAPAAPPPADFAASPREARRPAAAPADRERKAALRARLDVALYTPGNPQGRPLRLPLVPALDDATPHDRERLARFAAGGLGAMMGYGASATHRAKASILQCAI